MTCITSIMDLYHGVYHDLSPFPVPLSLLSRLHFSTPLLTRLSCTTPTIFLAELTSVYSRETRWIRQKLSSTSYCNRYMYSRMGQRICGALVQFGCCQHRYELCLPLIKKNPRWLSAGLFCCCCGFCGFVDTSRPTLLRVARHMPYRAVPEFGIY